MLDEQLIITDLGYLRRQAERCSRLATAISDRRASELLATMAGEFERLAQRAETRGSARPAG